MAQSQSPTRGNRRTRVSENGFGNDASEPKRLNEATEACIALGFKPGARIITSLGRKARVLGALQTHPTDDKPSSLRLWAEYEDGGIGQKDPLPPKKGSSRGISARCESGEQTLSNMNTQSVPQSMNRNRSSIPTSSSTHHHLAGGISARGDRPKQEYSSFNNKPRKQSIYKPVPPPKPSTKPGNRRNSLQPTTTKYEPSAASSWGSSPREDIQRVAGGLDGPLPPLTSRGSTPRSAGVMLGPSSGADSRPVSYSGTEIDNHASISGEVISGDIVMSSPQSAGGMTANDLNASALPESELRCLEDGLLQIGWIQDLNLESPLAANDRGASSSSAAHSTGPGEDQPTPGSRYRATEPSRFGFLVPARAVKVLDGEAVFSSGMYVTPWKPMDISVKRERTQIECRSKDGYFPGDILKTPAGTRGHVIGVAQKPGGGGDEMVWLEFNGQNGLPPLVMGGNKKPVHFKPFPEIVTCPIHSEMETEYGPQFSYQKESGSDLIKTYMTFIKAVGDNPAPQAHWGRKWVPAMSRNTCGGLCAPSVPPSYMPCEEIPDHVVMQEEFNSPVQPPPRTPGHAVNNARVARIELYRNLRSMLERKSKREKDLKERSFAPLRDPDYLPSKGNSSGSVLGFKEPNSYVPMPNPPVQTPMTDALFAASQQSNPMHSNINLALHEHSHGLPGPVDRRVVPNWQRIDEGFAGPESRLQLDGIVPVKHFDLDLDANDTSHFLMDGAQ
mmetsp:Transcript_37240/g.45005  ORF Transcript_37240/g.45005 Transcript_37240/m.45005 type:complete len:730 (-) Transcript_37240:209-2398(-)|eukprot:CAMPEP_0197851538 /NCGR_PEP_ID=MMETSP1438-20131217/18286_1 /TAXON_ID=1461541 /ORGANISM="Pterosperma sp., Strain CCMP1384" /LENGTH=729 /DNA_ID=CAMNT_0043465161 /DNA_START=55 /DNA_END=2244 /DNA_ORIENTATION=-